MIRFLLAALIALALPTAAHAEVAEGSWALRIDEANIFVFVVERTDSGQWYGRWLRPASFRTNGAVFSQLTGSTETTSIAGREVAGDVELVFIVARDSGNPITFRFHQSAPGQVQLTYVDTPLPPFPLVAVADGAGLGPFDPARIYDRDNAATRPPASAIAPLAPAPASALATAPIAPAPVAAPSAVSSGPPPAPASTPATTPPPAIAPAPVANTAPAPVAAIPAPSPSPVAARAAPPADTPPPLPALQPRPAPAAAAPASVAVPAQIAAPPPAPALAPAAAQPSAPTAPATPSTAPASTPAPTPAPTTAAPATSPPAPAELEPRPSQLSADFLDDL